jgi:glycosyltransferase involved in cell wall biosynthesis
VTAAPRAFFYLEYFPQRTGSGAHLRLYSNVRAFVDLGYHVEVIQLAPPGTSRVHPEDLPNTEWTCVDLPQARPTWLGKLQFRMAYPGAQGLSYYFPAHFPLRHELLKHESVHPGSVHVLEGDGMANVIPFLEPFHHGGIRAVWSVHDIGSEMIAASHRIDNQITGRHSQKHVPREVAFLRAHEERTLRAAPLAICISAHDARVLQDRGCKAAEYLPMSIPDESKPTISTMDRAPALRVLHLGRINHLPSFRSLEFLLGQVWPLLDEKSVRAIQLNVVGTYDANDERCQALFALAEPYAETVRFHGFVSDLHEQFRNADMQVIASTEASGLRTRIVESFAIGVPVLSTAIAARGLEGLVNGKNILVASDAAAFAARLQSVIADRNQLVQIATSARRTYEALYARKVVAAQLGQLLSRYLEVPEARQGL